MATARRDALTRFVDELQRLRAHAGAPSLNQLVAATAGLEYPLARSTISDKLAAKSVPDWDFVVSFVAGCRLYAEETGACLPADAADLSRWETAHWRLLAELDGVTVETRLASAARVQLARRVPAADGADLTTMAELLDRLRWSVVDAAEAVREAVDIFRHTAALSAAAEHAAERAADHAAD
jgi:hypothetical protein